MGLSYWYLAICFSVVRVRSTGSGSRYERAIALARSDRDALGMSKRAVVKRSVAGFLWGYLVLYAWSMYSGLAGIDFMLGPAVALGALSILLIARGVRVEAGEAARTPAGISTESAPPDGVWASSN